MTGVKAKQAERRLTPWLTDPCQLPLHSSEGSSFSCFWEKKTAAQSAISKPTNMRLIKSSVVDLAVDRHERTEERTRKDDMETKLLNMSYTTHINM